MDTANLEAMLDGMAASFALSFYVFYYLVAIATYVLTALSLYTIAKRRFLFGGCAWLAWVPFAQFWVLGSIADEYQRIVWLREKKKRIVMLVLNIIQMVAGFFIMLGLFRIILGFLDAGITSAEGASNMLHYIEYKMDDYYSMSEKAKTVLSVLKRNSLSIGFWAVVTVATAVTYVVFYYMALYDLYRFCNPDNATVFLVFSILFGITIPIFMMICRQQDRKLHYSF